MQIGDGAVVDTYERWRMIYVDADERTEAPIKKRATTSYAEEDGEHTDSRSVRDAFDYKVTFLVEGVAGDLNSVNGHIRQFNNEIVSRDGDVATFKQIKVYNDYNGVMIAGLPEPIAEPQKMYKTKAGEDSDCAVVELTIRVSDPSECDFNMARAASEGPGGVAPDGSYYTRSEGLAMEAAVELLKSRVTAKQDAEAGKGLSANDYTDEEKAKLAGIEAGANKYLHPAFHKANEILTDANSCFVTLAQRLKIDSVEENANNYTHPATHPASMIVESEGKQFVTAQQKTKWESGALLPIDGICASRSEMQSKGYGTWAFPDEQQGGWWTVDCVTDWPNNYNRSRTDYCNIVGNSPTMYIPSPTNVYRCMDSSHQCGRLYIVGGVVGDNSATPLVELINEQSLKASRKGYVECLPIEGTWDFRDEVQELLDEEPVRLKQISSGGREKWVIGGDVTTLGFAVSDYGVKSTDFNFIEPKVGLLLQDKSTGDLWQVVECDEQIAYGGVRGVRLAGGADAVSPNKGLFADEDALKEAYPNPENGWHALVGDSFPAALWVAVGGEWTDSGSTAGESTIDLTAYDAQITALTAKIEALTARVAKLEKVKGLSEDEFDLLQQSGTVDDDTTYYVYEQ